MPSTTTTTLFLPLLLLLLLPTSLSRTDFFTCSPTNTYTTNSTYAANLALLLSSLTSSAPPTGFSNLTSGDPPDRAFGFALCRGDLNSTSCRSCLTTAALDVAGQCPGSLSGAVWYDGCRLRYSNEDFFSALAPNPKDPYFFSLRRVSDRDLFRDRFGPLMKDLRDRAAFGNLSGLFASGSIGLAAPDSLFGLVQCTRDLGSEQCARCLDEPIRQISCCEDSEEMTFQGGSCYLRYALFQFFNASVVAPPVSSRPLLIGTNTTGVEGTTLFKLGGKKKQPLALIIAIVLGAAILALLLLIALKARKKKKPKHIKLGTRNLELNENPALQFRHLTSKKISYLKNPRTPDSGGIDVQKLDIQTLKIATENFSENKKIGRGEFGVVYKGDLPGIEFVVKRITAASIVDAVVLKRGFKSFAKLQHANLVKLMAFHMEGDEKLLVYEYLPNMSLDRVLFDNKKRVLLDWGRRFKIIQGIAQGLLHLQGDSELNLIHQNLKASNILLDRQMGPKISDFSLPNFFDKCQTPGGTQKSSSTNGYMAPESVTNKIFTAKTDVFSYGVLVLEIVTGQRNRELLGSENTTNLLSYVWRYWREEKALQVLDWSLGELYKGHEVLRCIHVGLLCVQEDPEKRPNMSSIVHMLNSYSFTLPSPSAPAVVRGKRSNSGPQTGNGNSGNWDWKFFNQNVSQLSPQSPNGWSDVKLESR